MRRRITAALDLLIYPTLVTFGALIQPWDGGRLLRWAREAPEPEVIA